MVVRCAVDENTKLGFSCAEEQKTATGNYQKDARRQGDSDNASRLCDDHLISEIGLLPVGGHHDIAANDRSDSQHNQQYAHECENFDLEDRCCHLFLPLNAPGLHTAH